MNLDDVVPEADHVTRQSRVIDAPRTVVWEELHRLKLRSLPVTLVLGGIRALAAAADGQAQRQGRPVVPRRGPDPGARRRSRRRPSSSGECSRRGG